MLIERQKFLDYWDTSKSGIHKIFDDNLGGGPRLRGGPMQDQEELWWLLKRLEENISEFGQIKTILEVGVADGGGMKIWEQVLLEQVLLNQGNKFVSLKDYLYIGIDFRPNPLWDYMISPIDIRLISGDTHAEYTRNTVKNLLNGRKVDFLWIDAQHHSIDVEKDFIDYGGFVCDNRIIGFHDTRLCRSFWDRFTGGSIDAIDGSKEEYMIFKKEEYKNSLGTGIFYKLHNQNVIRFKDI